MPARESGRAPLDDWSIDALITAASNDPDARDRLLSRLRPEVARYCEVRLDQEMANRSDDAVVDDVCLAVMEALPTFRAGEQSFWSFVFGVAARTASQEREHEQDRGQAAPDGPHARTPAGAPEEADPDRERAALVNELLDHLPAQQREVLLLRVQGALTTAETAHLLGSAPASVRVAQHRAMTMIHRALRDSPLRRDGRDRPAPGETE